MRLRYPSFPSAKSWIQARTFSFGAPTASTIAWVTFSITARLMFFCAVFEDVDLRGRHDVPQTRFFFGAGRLSMRPTDQK